MGSDFAPPGSGEILPWSRILDDEESLIVVNTHGREARGGDVLVDAALNPLGSEFRVLANTSEVGVANYAGTYAVGSSLATKTQAGQRFVEIRALAPGEVLVLTNRP
jgi:hypothetical protein